MAGSFEIAPRTALAAPTDPAVVRVQSAVILVASLLSLLGAAWIMASFLVFPTLRTFRHYLIFGLAISDCVMALNFLLSSSLNVSGRWIGAPEQAQFCTFNGFMTQVFVIQTDYWVLIIAVCTYFVLADHKQSSSWVQTHSAVLWTLPWLFSIAWASVGLGVTGYGDVGAWCWFTSDQVRLLVNFVPRWAIIVAMFVMYARLYFILFRAHRHMASLDASGSMSGSGSRQLETGGTTSQHDTSGTPSRHTRRLKKLARLMLLYPLAYAVVWSLPTTIRIYQTISGEPAPWQVQTLDKACVVVQGFVDAVIYGATESSLSNWRNLLFPRKLPDAATATATTTAFGADGSRPATYGDVSRKPSRRLSSFGGGRHGGGGGGRVADDRQLVSRVSTREDEATLARSSSSVDSLGLPRGEQVEMGRLHGDAPMAGIRKTVEVQVRRSSTDDDRIRVPGPIPRPPKPYFPGGGHSGRS